MCTQSNGCTKKHPAMPVESISRWRSPLYACYGALMFLLDLAPGGVAEGLLQHPPGCPENLNGAPSSYPRSGETSAMTLTNSSGPELFPHIPQSSCVSSTFSVHSFSPSCAEAVPLAHSCLSGGIALNKGVHSMCSWRRGQAQHLPMMLSWTSLDKLV